MSAYGGWILQNKEFVGGKQNIKRRQICWVNCSLWNDSYSFTNSHLEKVNKWRRMTAVSNKYKSVQETCGVPCWLWRRIGLIERCREKSWKSEQDKQRRGGTYGCNGGRSLGRVLLIVTILHTRCKNEGVASVTLLCLEIDYFNLEVNKHHACSQHPNP